MKLIDAEKLVAEFWRALDFDEIYPEDFEDLINKIPTVKLEEKLEHYQNLDTYTDCEEYRREGAVGVLEDIIEELNPNKS